MRPAKKVTHVDDLDRGVGEPLPPKVEAWVQRVADAHDNQQRKENA